jgi:hypothetical protein
MMDDAHDSIKTLAPSFGQGFAILRLSRMDG